MSRCKACDAILEPTEMVWDDEIKQHEDMCYICRGIIADCEWEEAMSVYKEDTFDDITPKSKEVGNE